MTAPITTQITRTQHVTGAFAGLLSATLEVDEQHEAPWAIPLLENIISNLNALEGPDWRDRVSILIRALNPQDALLLSQSEIPANGLHFITEFFRRVPLLTEDQAIEKVTSNTDVNLNDLMHVQFAEDKFYLADQFTDDGSIHSECIELMNIFRQQPNLSNWEIATWWINPTGWLSGDRPRDVFKDKFEAVRNAARQEILHDER